jgi:phosphotransferase system  glucose/maltose/N-acetylglucosamine-specific IIC component
MTWANQTVAGISLRPSYVAILAGAFALFSAILVVVGLHHGLTAPNCSSTGYTPNFGPVSHCPKGESYFTIFQAVGIPAVITSLLVVWRSSPARTGAGPGIRIGVAAVAVVCSIAGAVLVAGLPG